MSTAIKPRKSVRKVKLFRVTSDHGMSYIRDGGSTINVARTKADAKRLLKADADREAESNAFHKEMKPDYERTPHKRKIEPFVGVMDHGVFMVVTVERPEGWQPRHSLDLPGALDGGTYGYDWCYDSGTEGDGFITREDALRQCSEWNAGDGHPNDRESDWRVVIEAGKPMGEILYQVHITCGVGYLETMHIERPIFVVRPTRAEIKEHAKPMPEADGKAVSE